MSGCNYGAKNTLAMNYLPVAQRHGAELFTGVRVTRLERRGERWLIRYEVLDCGRDRFDAPEMFLTADAVVLAAGTLGTAEILLRSRERFGGFRERDLADDHHVDVACATLGSPGDRAVYERNSNSTSKRG